MRRDATYLARCRAYALTLSGCLTVAFAASFSQGCAARKELPASASPDAIVVERVDAGTTRSERPAPSVAGLEEDSGGRAFRPQRNGLTLEAAREAYRRWQLRRHLRYLETLEPGFLLRATRTPAGAARSAGDALADLYETGRLLFEHEYGFADGLASGAARARRSPFRRVHEGRFGGPETTTCTSCHWRGGLAGAGSLQDASFFLGNGDRVSSADGRNPPPLQGVGVVELLAREMSAELAAIRTRLTAEARREGRAVEAELVAKGVRFGVLRVAADGAVDTSGVEGVDPDLVVKPFGWKGTFATLREFIAESLQVHLGIQSEDLVARHARHGDPELLGDGPARDPDGDGVTGELSAHQLTTLVAFLAMLELPVIRPPERLHAFPPIAENIPAPTATDFTPDWARGRELFAEIGCADCHRPALVLADPVFRSRSEATGELLEIDLARDGDRPGLEYDAARGGYPVWLFSDLKRHDMGPQNESRHVDHGVDPRDYLTRRLWGLAGSPPYFYDGSAPWLDHALAAHSGEAAESRRRFELLEREDRAALRIYLFSLRRERRLIVP